MTGADRIQSLDILLHEEHVGTLVRTPGDYHAFSLTQGYRDLQHPPTLSLSLRKADGGLRRDPRPIRGQLPPFFANLLPEEKLREAMEKHHAQLVRPGNDFDLLAVLGTNLPGAVRALPTNDVVIPINQIEPNRKTRFSLAGVQMKLSVMKNAGKESGFTLAVDDAQGQYIAKFPSLTHIGLSENEYAILALADALGMDVPPRELVEKTEFAGIPEEFNTLSTGRALLVRRFDRGTGGERIHIEDFAQVFGRYPSEKYIGGAYHNIAEALNAGVSFDAAIEFVRRLAFTAVTGNGDMHLKNWSLIYPGDGRTPQLSPLYDVLSTIPYLPWDGMALSVAGEKSFRALTPERWRSFANRSRLPEGAVVAAVAETATRARDLWPTLPERDLVPPQVLTMIDTHIDSMVAVLAPATPS
jgi:serine/threonine-protein kinase HipA